MTFFKPTLAAMLLLCASLNAAAHEFWMWPNTFALQPGGELRLSLLVGERFEGQLTGFGRHQARGLRHYSAASPVDLMAQVPQQDQADFALRLRRPGTHVIAYDSAANLADLPADKFNAYLADEGLEHIARQREASGAANTPGRERFSRNVKTMISVGGRTDASYRVRTGQRLEIVPLADPLKAAAPATLRFRLLFDNKPLAQALLKAWHKQDGKLVTARARSDAQGRLSLTLPHAGPWMLSVVHMIPATGVPDLDWDSYWGNLIFALPARR